MSVSSLISSTRASLVTSVCTEPPASNGPGPWRKAKLRAGAVGVSLVLAEVQVDPAGELAAQDRVHHRQREVVGRAPGDADLADGQDRLRRAGLVDQVDRHRLARSGGSGSATWRPAARLPALQGLLQDRRRSRRAWCRRRRSWPRCWARTAACRSATTSSRVSALDRLRRAEVGAAVGVRLRRRGAWGRRCRRSPSGLSARRRSCESRWPRSRSSSFSGKAGCSRTSVYRSSALAVCLVRVVSERLLDSRPPSASIEAPISASSPASWSESRVAVPSVSRSAGQRGEPLLAGGDERLAPLDDQVQRQDRQLVPLGDQDLQAVGELPADDRRRGERRGSGRAWASLERSKSSLIGDGRDGRRRGACAGGRPRPPGRGVGGPGSTSRRTRLAVRYLLATRLTSAGVTAKSLAISAL